MITIILNDNNKFDKPQPANGGFESCHQPIPVGSAPTVWVAEHGPSGDSQSRINLFATDSSGNN